MIILPAIDLIGGQAVRLVKGDYAQKTVYAPDPLEPVRAFEAAGAQWLHLVDLEGAKSGAGENKAAVARILKHTRLRVELGGGIRDMDAVAYWLGLGVSRVVLGTAAVTEPGFAARAAARYGDRIAVGADARDGYVAVHGWTEQSQLALLPFCQDMAAAGVQTLICTDISRDGAMAGVSLDFYRELQAAVPAHIVASGGVSSLADVAALRGLGLYGAIVGKAYYTGALDLSAAIALGKGDMA